MKFPFAECNGTYQKGTVILYLTVSVKGAVQPNPGAVTVIETVPEVVGSVYVVEAVPLLPVWGDGFPNAPPAPPSLNVTVTPESGFPVYGSSASTCSDLGNVVPGLPD